MIAGFSITSLLLILLAGIGAGFVGYAVGASSLVSYPALLAFGIPPVLANASNTVGVVGTGIGGVMGARKELKGQAVRSITYVVIGAFGGVAGAFLLLKLDPSVFEFAAPVLILLSSLIIAINPRGRMQASKPPRMPPRNSSTSKPLKPLKPPSAQPPLPHLTARRNNSCSP